MVAQAGFIDVQVVRLGAIERLALDAAGADRSHARRYVVTAARPAV